jgi:ABC-type nitrate/sulfonate/bicarbonate transport system substrate-binding protein
MKVKISILLAIVLAVGGGFLVWKSLHSPADRVLAGKNKIRFQLQWIDQAQFAGFYVADSMGFYRDEGLDVELIPGAFNVNPIAKVVSHEADIGMATGDQVLQRSADGLRLKAIGTVFDHSVACFVALTNSNITKPEDLRGKKIAVFRSYDTDNLLRVLLKHLNIAESEVTVADASGDVAQLIKGEVDAYGAYVFNEPLELKAKGHSITVISPEANGIHFYSDTLITTPEYLRDNRDLVVKFIRASRRGWEYAKAHPDEAVDKMIQLNRGMARDPDALAAQRRMCLSVIENLQSASGRSIFTMDPSRWQEMTAELISVNRLGVDFQQKLNDICDYKVAEEAAK